MKRCKRIITVLMAIAVMISMMPLTTFAAVKKPGTPKITKAAVNQKTAKVTVRYKRAKNAKSYRLYRRTAKTGWKYYKTVKASQKKKYSGKKLYKLVKSGKKYKVYKKKTTYSYKQLATGKKTSMSFTGKWNTSYVLVVRAYNGKTAGSYSAAKTVKIGKKPEPAPAPVPAPDCDTYVFFGSDSRRNDELWKSQDGGPITTDHSSHENGVPRSDVIMLLNVNKTDKTIEMASVYRDTSLNLSADGFDFRKVNQAYSDYGPKEACRVLERNLDISIKGYAVANFKGVAEVIDDLCDATGSGIEVSGLNVETNVEGHGNDVTDVANEYLDEMNRIYGTSVPYIEHGEDTQSLNGFQAVAYCRVRYTAGDDAKRTERQSIVLGQMIEKFNSLGDDSKKMSIILDNMAGIEVGFMDGSDEDRYERLADLLCRVSEYKRSGTGFPYEYKDKNDPEHGWLKVPRDLLTNVVKLHQQIYKENGYAPSETVRTYSQELERKTGVGVN